MLHLGIRRQEVFRCRADPVYLRRTPPHEHNQYWQRSGGYDRVLRTDEVIQNTIRSIHLSPVRRVLMNTSEDWKWSNAWSSTEAIGRDRCRLAVGCEREGKRHHCVGRGGGELEKKVKPQIMASIDWLVIAGGYSGHLTRDRS